MFGRRAQTVSYHAQFILSSAVQAIAAAGAVPIFVRLLQSKNELVAEGASEAMLHIVTPSQQEGGPAQAPSHAALRAAGAIPTLLNLVRN